MRAAPRSISVSEAQEVLFVDRVQHFDGGTLDDFVFQRGNAERAKLARFTHLLDVHSAHRSCPVRSSLEPLGEIVEVFLKGLSVLLPRLAVYARGSAPLHFQVRCSQPIHVIDVVQERGEPLFLIALCCLTYSLKRAERALPALSPERVALGRIPFGQPPFPPSPPQPVPRPCSATSQVLWNCPTSRFRSSSACVLRLPDAVCGSLFRRRTRDLPVPEQGVSVHARGL